MENAQRMARAAQERISQRPLSWELASLAHSFPSLVQSFGLAQAVALAKAHGHGQYLEDLAAVLAAAGHAEAASAGSLQRATLEHSVTAYVRLSCDTLRAAACLKDSIEALVRRQAAARPGSRADGAGASEPMAPEAVPSATEARSP